MKTDVEQDKRMQGGTPDFASTLARGLAVIEAFAEGNRQMTLSEVADKVGLSRAGARRILLTLVELGYATKDKRQFALAPRVLNLGYAFLKSRGVDEVVDRYLKEVTERVSESCSLGVLDGGEVVYIARSSAAHRLMAVSLHVGARLPAHATSMGRILLAQLADDEAEALVRKADLHSYTKFSLTDPGEIMERVREARHQGYCIVDEELEVGLRSISVPIPARGGRPGAAINVSCHAARVSRGKLVEEFLPELRRSAVQIGEVLQSFG
ncbi:MAG: helix-turn-helix domain-containing protein [Rhodobiaceae bacterium]|nr:helix-turn-helix domain-containing protein [Rhodobiaceae bacterium]